MKAIREFNYFWLILAITLIFVGIYSWLGYATAPISGERILNSPDEMANFYFIKIFANEGRLSVINNLGVDLGPRAVKALEGRIMPGSFLGMILIYGLIAKIFGSWLIIYLTPLFSLFGVLFFYKLIKEIFNSKIAFISSLLLLILPAFCYYNARSMFHNVLFLDFLIISFYFLVNYLQTQKIKPALCLGFFLGLALITRSSEALWLIPVLIIILVVNRQKFKINIIIGLLFLIAVIVILGYFQGSVYGSPFSFGYSLKAPEISDTNREVENYFRYFLPFGFHPKLIVKNVFNYLISFFWWFSIPAVIGYLMLFLNIENNKKQRFYLLLYTFASVFLIIYYGSWSLADNLNFSLITIGTSYVRYWLPIYVFALPFVSFVFVRFVNLFKNILLKWIFILAIIFICLSSSIFITFTGTAESLTQVRERIAEYYLIRNKVSAIIPEDSLIVTDRHDKVFFPKFKVAAKLIYPEQLEFLSKATSVYPTYYYDFLGNKNISEINVELKEYNLELVEPINIFRGEKLYRVVKREE